MAAIEGIEGLSAEALDYQISLGGRFVVYSYAISVLVMSFRRSSNVQFVRSDENAALRGLPYTLLAALLGWWGIPWGPIFTVQALATNLGGRQRRDAGGRLDAEGSDELARRGRLGVDTRGRAAPRARPRSTMPSVTSAQ